MPLKPKVQPPSETSSETRPTCKIFISFRPLISLKRLNTPLPVYKTTFACTGSVGGKTFTSSSSTLTNRRSAEQDAAKLLHYNIYSMGYISCYRQARFIGIEGSVLVLYFQKICGKNKKEDEQLAALSAILSLLDDPIYGTQISEVLNSKFSACAVFKDCSVTSNEFKATTSNVRKKKQDLVNSLPQIENKVNKTSLPQTEASRDHFKVFLCEYAKNFTISLRTTTGKIKFQEATKPASQQIGEFVPAPAAAHNPCNDSIFSRKRRRKNKEKANKRLRAENNSTLTRPLSPPTDASPSQVTSSMPLKPKVQPRPSETSSETPPTDDPTYATQISEVINSKFSACDCSVTRNEFKATTSNGDVMPLTQQALSINLHANSIGEQGGPGILTEKQGGQGVLDDTQCVSGHFPGAVTISRCSYVNMPRTSPLVSEPQHETKLPEAKQLPFNQIGVPIELVLVPAEDTVRLQEATKPASQQIGEFVPVPAAAHNLCNDSIFSKKRRKKNKENANKRLRAENNLRVQKAHVM
ncbi:hypothetical protein F2Q70_00006531 [Brassica cretica]|uniref:Uncharacterized protein n=1 Tax=Brassica cretica TaxID=69181 RepID=A0A8S9J490_BRACR|nr:hypothetical protein F2Q70_00006531 [Brassica cretica]